MTRREPTGAVPFVFCPERDSWVCLHHGEQDYTYWVNCWQCAGDGEFDLHEEDPLLFDDGEMETCSECHGNGGFRVCPICNENNPDAEA